MAMFREREFAFVRRREQPGFRVDARELSNPTRGSDDAQATATKYPFAEFGRTPLGNAS